MKTSSLASTDQHLRAVLSHPLLSLKSRGSAVPTSGGSERKPGPSLLDTNDPMASFERSVALGTATNKLAAACLAATSMALIRDATTQEAKTDLSQVAQQMRESRAGTKVLNWMWSKGRLYVHDLIHGRWLMQELVPFLLAEHRQDVIWEWIGAPIRSSSDEGRARAVVMKSRLLLALTRAAWRYGRRDSKVVDHYLRGSRLGPGMSHGAGPQPETLFVLTAEELKPFLLPTGRLLRKAFERYPQFWPCWSLSRHSLGSFLMTVPTWSACPQYHLAMLFLLAPSLEDPTAALAFLRASSEVDAEDQFAGAMDEPRRRTALLEMARLTAETLHEQRRPQDADWVRSYLHRLVSEDRETSTSKTPSEAPSSRYDGAGPPDETEAIEALNSLLPPIMPSHQPV